MNETIDGIIGILEKTKDIIETMRDDIDNLETRIGRLENIECDRRNYEPEQSELK